ncbi:MAG: hypothetical protein DMG99_04100 [Acidobacteria bacterium]|nr:MAG: hypothetical protein DMG99_04100 [Acidobacteriota bacterium]
MQFRSGHLSRQSHQPINVEGFGTRRWRRECAQPFPKYGSRVDEKAPPLVTGLEERREYPRGTETILLLEDEESLRQVTCECLTANGYNVLQAGRGNQAIDVAEQYKGPIALIVSDVVLPDMSRPSVATKVRARRRYRAGHYQRTKNSRRCDTNVLVLSWSICGQKKWTRRSHTRSPI